MAVQPNLPPTQKSNELLRFFFASFSQGFAGFCTKLVVMEQCDNYSFLKIFIHY
jgi:hypothetical protein